MPASPVRADHDQDAAAEAAREIQAAQDRADQLVEELFDTAGRIEQLDEEIVATEAKLAELQAAQAATQSELENAAVQRFVGFGSTPMPLLAGFADANDAASADVYYAIANDTAAVDLNDLDVAQDLTADTADSLGAQRDEAAKAKTRYAELQEQAETEIARLQELELVRARDAEVAHEVQRQERERAAREAAEREAERVAQERAAQQARDEQARAAAAAKPPSASDTPSAARGGGGGAPPAIEPEPQPQAAGNIICPIAGPNAFGDTWGAARSGGRSHEGVDMMSPGGTPLVAVESGTVQFKTNKLGGNTIWLNGASGTNYYYAHLSAWEGSSRSVSQGDVIGYVGATGNTSANHLHLQIHPGGGTSVNPYPYVRAVC